MNSKIIKIIIAGALAVPMVFNLGLVFFFSYYWFFTGVPLIGIDQTSMLILVTVVSLAMCAAAFAIVLDDL